MSMFQGVGRIGLRDAAAIIDAAQTDSLLSHLPAIQDHHCIHGQCLDRDALLKRAIVVPTGGSGVRWCALLLKRLGRWEGLTLPRMMHQIEPWLRTKRLSCGPRDIIVVAEGWTGDLYKIYYCQPMLCL